jgi:hypothetical protein
MPFLWMRDAPSRDDMHLTNACAASGCFDTASTPTANNRRKLLASAALGRRNGGLSYFAIE